MKSKLVLAAVLAVAGAASVSGANAGVVLSDNFDVGNGKPNYSGDAIFESIPQPGNVLHDPSVDLVGPGFFPALAFSGDSIDLDGSTGYNDNPTGEILSYQSLGLGDYKVSFELAGNLRDWPAQTTVVSIGSQSQSITPANNQGYQLYTLIFTGASGKVSFLDNGPSDFRGNLLDNVVVSTAVPEASTWAMMVAGFVGLGFAGYRARKGNRIAQFS
jgi:hypothetical protein